jgi:hypothetical protein
MPYIQIDSPSAIQLWRVGLGCKHTERTQIHDAGCGQKNLHSVYQYSDCQMSHLRV